MQQINNYQKSFFYLVKCVTVKSLHQSNTYKLVRLTKSVDENFLAKLITNFMMQTCIKLDVPWIWMCLDNLCYCYMEQSASDAHYTFCSESPKDISLLIN